MLSADSAAAVSGIVALIDIIVMMPCLQPGQAALGNSWGFGRVRGGRPNSSCGTENNDIPEPEILTAHTLKQEGQPGGPGFEASQLSLVPPSPRISEPSQLLFWVLPRGILITMGTQAGRNSVEGGVSKGWRDFLTLVQHIKPFFILPRPPPGKCQLPVFTQISDIDPD